MIGVPYTITEDHGDYVVDVDLIVNVSLGAEDRHSPMIPVIEDAYDIKTKKPFQMSDAQKEGFNKWLARNKSLLRD